MSVFLGLTLTGAAALGSCSSDETASSSGAGATASTGSSSTTGAGGFGGTPSNYPCDGCTMFPPLDAPQCDAQTLGPATIAYPMNGMLLPPNMNVLEVQFVPPKAATLFEVDFGNAITTVTVETKCVPVPDVRMGQSKGCGVTLPQMAWNDIADKNRDGDAVHVTVRATVDGSCVSTSTDKIDLYFAKEDLKGGIYYWQSATYGGIGGKTGGIYSHDFGTFDPTPTPFMTAGDSGTCIGCHTLSRDGIRMAVMSDDPDADDEMGDVKSHLVDVAARAFIAAGASPGFQTFTHDHTKMIASTFKTNQDKSFAIVNGDTGAAITTSALPTGMQGTHPNLSKDDKTLIFVVPGAGTLDKSGDHHFMSGSLYSAAFDSTNNTIGMPSVVLGSTGTTNYYYPDLSPTQTFLLFNEAPDGDAFWNPKARVKLIHFPAASAPTPIDLKALNADASFGNSWPRWSPFVQAYKGHKLLWVTFSSNRDYGLHLTNKGFSNCYPPESPTYDQPQPLSKTGVGYENCAQPQIWMAAILVDDDASLDAQDRSFPAFWLPFQDVNAHNFSAQWVEQIPNSGQPDGGTCATAAGAACGASMPCCSQYVCCNGTCQDASSCVN